MSKTIAVFGAGVGWSYYIAKVYAQHGYNVALVSRTASKLDGLASKLSGEVPGIKVVTFPADIFNLPALKATSASILTTFSSVDVVYLGHVPADFKFDAAVDLTIERLQQNFEGYLYPAVTLVREFLPGFLAKGSAKQQHNNFGLILQHLMKTRGIRGSFVFGMGGSYLHPRPNASGITQAYAALRTYALALHAELAPRHVHVGIAVVSAAIRGSEAGDAILVNFKPEDLAKFPIVNAEDLGQLVWDLVESKAAEKFAP